MVAGPGRAGPTRRGHAGEPLGSTIVVPGRLGLGRMCLAPAGAMAGPDTRWPGRTNSAQAGAMTWSRAGSRSKLHRKGHGPGQNSVGASAETSRKTAVSCTGGWTGAWRLRASVCSWPSGNQHSHGGRLGLRTSGLTRTVLLYSEYSRCLQEATTDVTQIDLQPESHWRRPSCPPCPCSIVTARPDLPPPPLPPANLKDHNTDNLNGRGSGTWTEQEASQLPGAAQGREVESSADAYLCSHFLLCPAAFYVVEEDRRKRPQRHRSSSVGRTSGFGF